MGVKLEGTKIVVATDFKVDKDNDGKNSVEHVGQLKIDPLEIFSEVAKKDINLFDSLVAEAKASAQTAAV